LSYDRFFLRNKRRNGTRDRNELHLSRENKLINTFDYHDTSSVELTHIAGRRNIADHLFLLLSFSIIRKLFNSILRVEVMRRGRPSLYE
jgi:hypothetical protein